MWPLSLVYAWPDYFGQLAQGDRHILVEKQSYASGRPRPDLITIKEADGRSLARLNEHGYYSPRLEVPAEVFRYFANNGLICRDSQTDSDNDKAVFRLAPDALRLAEQLGWLPPMPPDTDLLHLVLLACHRVLSQAV